MISDISRHVSHLIISFKSVDEVCVCVSFLSHELYSIFKVKGSFEFPAQR